MKKSLLRTSILAASLLLVLAACGPHSGHNDQADQSVVPVSGFVSDMPSFDSFIATKPTAEQFRHAYPDVQLVMPGDITTREFRNNNSRYYADLDESGRIIGGGFQ